MLFEIFLSVVDEEIFSYGSTAYMGSFARLKCGTIPRHVDTAGSFSTKGCHGSLHLFDVVHAWIAHSQKARLMVKVFASFLFDRLLAMAWESHTSYQNFLATMPAILCRTVMICIGICFLHQCVSSFSSLPNLAKLCIYESPHISCFHIQFPVSWNYNLLWTKCKTS